MRKKANSLPKSPRDKAAEIALRYGMIRETHHQSWVIDQMLRCILGDKYQQRIERYNDGLEQDDHWDIGIAP